MKDIYDFHLLNILKIHNPRHFTELKRGKNLVSLYFICKKKKEAWPANKNRGGLGKNTLVIIPCPSTLNEKSYNNFACKTAPNVIRDNY